METTPGHLGSAITREWHGFPPQCSDLKHTMAPKRLPEGSNWLQESQVGKMWSLHMIFLGENSFTNGYRWRGNAKSTANDAHGDFNGQIDNHQWENYGKLWGQSSSIIYKCKISMENYGRTIGNYGTITFFNGDLQAVAAVARLLVESRTSGIANNSLQKGLPLPKLQGCRTFTRCPNEDRKTNIYHKHLEMFVSFFWGGVEFDRFRRNEENEESWHHSIESCDIVRYRAISCDIVASSNREFWICWHIWHPIDAGKHQHTHAIPTISMSWKIGKRPTKLLQYCPGW